MSNMMVLGGGDLGESLGCESGALTNGISTLIKETPGNSLPLSPSEDMARR